MGLKRLFVTTATFNTSAAAVNMLGTVLLVRWFGSDIYANYIVDLSYLSLLVIFMEVVPTNYSLFRVQDDPAKYQGLAVLAIVSICILLCVSFLSCYIFKFFHANSLWIVPYASSLAIKRYIDTRLQSTGRLAEYFGIELRGAIIRVVLMACLFYFAIQPIVAIWSSIACATLLTQIMWFIKNADERAIFKCVFYRSSWIPLVVERKAYLPYYLGIILKRLSNNIVTILASVFFKNRAELGSFFLAYRGLLFTLGQIRVIEGLLNHRHTLSRVNKLSMNHQILVAIVCQFVCIVVSCALELVSGVDKIDYLTIVILSFCVWVSVVIMLERAKAYSSYNTLSVNISMASYSIALSLLVFTFILLDIRYDTAFSFILVCSEVVSLFAMVTTVQNLTIKNWPRCRENT